MIDLLGFLDLPYNTRIVLEGAGLLGAVAGVIGTFAVLRRRALTGDALAHAALPGLCLAFLVVGERNLAAMLVGALVTGIIGLIVIGALRRWTRIKEDAGTGIVLSVFFGAGIVLSSIIQRMGGGSRAGLDSFILGKAATMNQDDVRLIGTLAVATLVVLLLLYKEFKLLAFDPGFARSQGWPVARLDLAMMGLVALAVVIGLPAVGVVMMAALLILPAAAARFWTDRLGALLVLAGLFGMSMGVAGTLISAQVRGLPAGPTIILVGTALFLVSAVVSPRRGLLARGRSVLLTPPPECDTEAT
jgi:manganese/zinc/iron transport system permease protein